MQGMSIFRFNKLNNIKLEDEQIIVTSFHIDRL
jgi:hypothetical protein